MFSISVATNIIEKENWDVLLSSKDVRFNDHQDAFSPSNVIGKLFCPFLCVFPHINIMSTQLNKIMETNNVLFLKCFVYLTFSMNKSEIYLWYILYCSKLHINKNDNSVCLTHMKICMLQLPK